MEIEILVFCFSDFLLRSASMMTRTIGVMPVPAAMTTTYFDSSCLSAWMTLGRIDQLAIAIGPRR